MVPFFFTFFYTHLKGTGTFYRKCTYFFSFVKFYNLELKHSYLIIFLINHSLVMGVKTGHFTEKIIFAFYNIGFLMSAQKKWEAWDWSTKCRLLIPSVSWPQLWVIKERIAIAVPSHLTSHRPRRILCQALLPTWTEQRKGKKNCTPFIYQQSEKAFRMHSCY